MRNECLTDNFSRYNYYLKRKLIQDEIISENKVTLILKKGTVIVIPMDIIMKRKIILGCR